MNDIDLKRIIIKEQMIEHAKDGFARLLKYITNDPETPKQCIENLIAKIGNR